MCEEGEPQNLPLMSLFHHFPRPLKKIALNPKQTEAWLMFKLKKLSSGLICPDLHVQSTTRPTPRHNTYTLQ